MTAEELAKMPEPELRREVTRMLEKGPWPHVTSISDGDYYEGWVKPCKRCEECEGPFPQKREDFVLKMEPSRCESKERSCPIPPPAKGTMTDMAERLLRNLLERDDRLAIKLERLAGYEDIKHPAWPLSWWLKKSSREQVCCLLALRESQSAIQTETKDAMESLDTFQAAAKKHGFLPERR